MTAFSAIVALVRHGNDTEALMTEVILPLAIDRLYGQLTMPQLVSVDTADEAKNHGDTIRIAKPIEFADADDHPTDSAGSQSEDITAGKVDVKLDRHLYKQFAMKDVEFLAHANSLSLPSAAEAAVDALARTVNKNLFSLYKDIPYISGNPASTAGRDKTDLIAARKEMQNRKILNGRNIVLTSDTEADLLLEFSKINETGDANVVSQGLIGRKYGFDLYSDVQAPYHVAGSAAANAGMTLAAQASVGATVLTLDGVGDATFLKGDVLTIAGSHQTFVVTADTAGVAVPVYPAVLDGIAAGTAVSVVGDHPVDLAFTKSAFLIAFRNLEVPEDAAGVNFAQMSDPRTGISLRMLRWYEPRTESTQWKFETLCGLKTVSPERALRLGGH
ncbi:P22 phage major capsid protein family protein [Pseudomonas plecoglossicida]|uniref:P22 phage major capsid protein family protein n=1 Tax=Pseudomonas putida group TaxID=136845 RepID=UPI0024105760|nr:MULTISPECIES: P22 phage major capsid protein family protein [Pseudomonas putida group]MDQ7965902.1 P22 phage major capsid protein family protein [Pseudomonas plecoglossicida]WFG01096.1 P22 phage major capsid protein family protein [Pseudomonas putida]